MSTICHDNLTDIEYLDHMVPHHQVAVDISLILQKKNKICKNAKNIKRIN